MASLSLRHGIMRLSRAMWAQRMSTSAPLVVPDNLFIDPEKPVHINRIVQDFAQLQGKFQINSV